MSEQTFPVEIIGVEYICDNCNEGKMVYTGKMNLNNSSNPTYPHICEVCATMKEFDEKYPTIRHCRKI